MKDMKKLSIIFTIVALMLNVMSVSAAHACAQDNNGTQIIKAVDDFANDANSVEKVHCTQCSCHHHSSAAFVSKSSGSEFFSASTEAYNWDNTVNYSQLQYPPSKPPKA